jgi:hypothetical protein
MYKKIVNIRIFAISAIVILVAVSFHPALDPFWDYVSSLPEDDFDLFSSFASASELDDIIISSMKPDQDINISELNGIAIDNGDIDTDGDGLYDSVEWVLGTDPENVDSDFDTLDDYYEVANGLDPQKADSNNDGLVDNLEIKDVTWDFDSDGIPNIWDPDNDDDDVPDNIDSSPFAKSVNTGSFHFDVQTNGNPTYLDFQLRPETTEHLKLSLATWDWPADTKGQMQDRDGSVEDVQLYPMLELTMNSRPAQLEVEDYGIVVPQVEENTGGFVTHGITVGDINRNGELDLVFFGGNQGTDPVIPGYTIGWDMGYPTSESFAPSRWSPMKPNNQYQYSGAGKVIDLNNNGYPEIYMPRIGDYDDEYRYAIRYGIDLDKYGNPKPNQNYVPFRLGGPTYFWGTGSGLDIADINGNGKPDLFIAHVQQFGDVHYNIGWDLDFKSDPDFYNYGDTDNWQYDYFTPRMPFERFVLTHAAVKLTDIDGNGVVDLLAMGTDDGASQLHYLVGWNLDASGHFESWSEIKTYTEFEVGMEGGGVVAHDFNGNGKLDLLVLGVDNAEKHDFHYAIGWDLDSNGDITSWSSEYKCGTNLAKTVYVPLTPVADFGNNVAFSGRMFFPAGSAEELSIDAKLVWMATGETDNSDGTSEQILLAKYRENFMLTGFTATENYGTDAGLFYSDDIDQTVAAGFVLAYEFLRTQSPLTDMPDKFDEYGVSSESQTMYSEITPFPHQDAAFVGLTSEMMEDALEILPVGGTLPIIFAMEDHFASTDLSELIPENDGKNYGVDLRMALVLTTKMFQMNWYDTASRQLLGLDSLLDEMKQWDLEADVLENVMKTAVVWSAGDATVTRIGSEEIQFVNPEKSEVLNTLSNVQSIGLKAIRFTRVSLGIYRHFKTMPELTKVSWSSLNGLAKGIKQNCRNIKAAGIGKLGKVNTVARSLSYMGYILDLGMGFYTFFDVASSLGWSDVGVALGLKGMSYELAYGLILTGLAMIPFVGWIIALGVGISDAIGGWFGDILQDIFDWLGSWRPRSEVDLSIGESSFGYDDYDANGLDVGDRIDLYLVATTTINTVNKGSYDDLWSSYLNYNLACITTYTQNKNNERWKLSFEYEWNNKPYFESTTYQNLFWAEPSQAMINFPWKIWITYNYKLYADEIFFGSEERVYFKDSGKSESFYIYMDILPGDVDAFLAWNAITPLDRDRDGLLDNSGEDPNPNNYDTDGDGLPDGFEVLSSLNPLNADPDGDGLSDLEELRLGTDPSNADTDGDGLSDGTEYWGWEISFTYGGQLFTSHVSSNPLQIDTDGDDVSDLDEFIGPLWDCVQGNPRSQDTNGNGIKDRLNFVPEIFIDASIDIDEGEELALPGYFIDPDPDIWTAIVDYGDGSGTQPFDLNPDKTFALNHVYRDNGTYTLTVSISDGSVISGNADIIVTVTNAAPIVDAGADVEVFLGQTFNLKAGFNDPGIDDKPWKYTIYWGDDSSKVDGSTNIQGSNTIISSHKYSALGDYEVTVTVTDKDGGTGTDTLQVDVNRLEIKIDIKPGSDSNPINLNSNGVIPVAILTDNDFDASTADVSTVLFGPSEAEPVHYAMEDVDHDGDADMILHFRTQEVGLEQQDTEAILIGQTMDGIYFIGKDVVRIVPPKDNPKPPGKNEAPGQNKEPGEPADGKGKNEAPGQNKEPGEPAKGKGKNNVPGQNKIP